MVPAGSPTAGDRPSETIDSCRSPPPNGEGHFPSFFPAALPFNRELNEEPSRPRLDASERPSDHGRAQGPSPATSTAVGSAADAERPSRSCPEPIPKRSPPKKIV